VTSQSRPIEVAGEQWVRENRVRPLADLFDAAMAAIRD
jgi:hypothetical protein